MILALIPLAAADPDVLRVPAAHVALQVGAPEQSAVVWFGAGGVAVSASGDHAGAYAAVRTSPHGSGWDAGAAAGLVVPFVSPSPSAEAVGWFGPRHRGRWLDLELALVAPFAVRPQDAQAAIDGRLDGRVGAHFGAFTVSVMGAAGLRWASDASWTTDLRAGVGLGWDGPSAAR